MSDRPALLQLLDAALERGGLQTDDVIAVYLPLLAQVATLHENGLVAVLDGPFAFAVDDSGHLALKRPQGTHPVSNRPALERMQAPVSSVLHLVGDREVAAGTVAVRSRGGKDLGPMPLAEVVARMREEIERKT